MWCPVACAVTRAPAHYAHPAGDVIQMATVCPAVTWAGYRCPVVAAAIRGRAPCDRCGAEPKKLLKARPRATAVGQGPKSCWGLGPVQSPCGRALEAVGGWAPCNRRGAGP